MQTITKKLNVVYNNTNVIVNANIQLIGNIKQKCIVLYALKNTRLIQ